MKRYICIHGHFYQPPRENPWLDEVELQDSAYPYHDWNQRITAECYAPNTASRILDSEKRIIDIVNNYRKMSFNFGPTLLSWFRRHHPDLYESIIEVDRQSRKEFSGHGSALAQAYNHMIMPLANSRDKLTQVLWGIRDFERRFGRKPEGMWLPETGVDLATLDIMAGQGIKFTVLAPHQARRVRKIDGDAWQDVAAASIDPRRPYLCRLPSGGTIALFFYDGPMSRDVSFGDVLKDGGGFARRLVSTFSSDGEEAQLVHIATDGETYGHHHRFGDMSLAYCHYYIGSNNLAEITNYGEFLADFPPRYEAEIFEDTSWSCVHGVERWRDDCGCKTGGDPSWNQKWRAHLRDAMDWLRDSLIPIYEEEGGKYLNDPWAARDGYYDVIYDRSTETAERFFAEHASGDLAPVDKVTVLKLLEMQHHAMLMYTSCGWFFNDLSGIETVQVIGYAYRAMQLAAEVRDGNLESGYRRRLKKAESNKPEFGDGARIADKLVKPAMLDLLRVGAHYAVSSLFRDYSDTASINCYSVDTRIYKLKEAGRQKCAVGKIHIRSDYTWEEQDVSFAVLHLGDHNIVGGVRAYEDGDEFETMRREIETEFDKSDLPDIIRSIDKHFGSHNYSLWHLFGDEQRDFLHQIVEPSIQDIKAHFRQVAEINYPVMNAMRELNVPLPDAFSAALKFLLNSDLEELLRPEDEFDLDRLQQVVSEFQKWEIEPDKTGMGFLASGKIDGMMAELEGKKSDIALLGAVSDLLAAVDGLGLYLDLWKAQNVYFAIGRELFHPLTEKAASGDKGAAAWIESFNRLGGFLDVTIV